MVSIHPFMEIIDESDFVKLRKLDEKSVILKLREFKSAFYGDYVI